MITIRRRVEPVDCFLLFAWRLLPDVRRWSFKDPPSWHDHLLYFEELMDLQRRKRISYYMALVDDMPVGVLILSGNTVNIMVSDLHRRKGVAKALLQAAQEKEGHMIAHVVMGNIVAAKLFVSCGFELVGSKEVEHKATITFLWKRRDHERTDDNPGVEPECAPAG